MYHPNIRNSKRNEKESYQRNAMIRDFPVDPVVKNLPSNAGNMSLIPGQGTKISHATGQLSPCTTTREDWMLQNRCSTKNMSIISRCLARAKATAHGHQQSWWEEGSFLSLTVDHEWGTWVSWSCTGCHLIQNSQQAYEKCSEACRD